MLSWQQRERVRVELETKYLANIRNFHISPFCNGLQIREIVTAVASKHIQGKFRNKSEKVSKAKQNRNVPSRQLLFRLQTSAQ